MIVPIGIVERSSDDRGSFRSTYLCLASAAGALGGLLFGYDWVVIGGAKPFYERYFHLDSPSLEGWAMSCALIGCLLGAMTSGGLSNRFGRKRLLTLAALTFTVSSLGTGLALHFDAFVAWRIMGGYAIGLASGISPMYIAEISPARLRGRLVSLNQVAIVFGILLAQIVNWLIARPVAPGSSAQQILQSWNGQWGWRWMFGITAIPSVLFLLASLVVPESPRWLAAKGRREDALGVLERLGGRAYAEHVLEDFAAVSEAQPERPVLEELRAPGMGKVLMLGIALAVLQQWCGINVIFNYAQEIFAAAGYQVSDILFNIVVTGAVNVIFTFVAFFMIDRFGRRFLLLTGLTGLVLIYYGSWSALSRALAREADAGACPGCHCLLCHVAGSCDVGCHFGDFSQSRPEQRSIDRSYRTLVSLLSADLHVSFAQCCAGTGGYVLDLCGSMPNRRVVSVATPAGDQRKDT